MVTCIRSNKRTEEKELNKTYHPRTAQVGRDHERSSGSDFCGKGSLDHIIKQPVQLNHEALL